MRVLITGGAGFIGSHLAERLVGMGHDVVVLDSEATGRPENVPEGADYRVGDVTRVADLEGAFGAGLDAVAHIAGQVSLIRSFTDPIADLRTNLEGTVNVLGCCLRHRVPRLLYASSMTVYGHNGTLPTPEDTPCTPVSYYGITKYAAERYVHTTAERPDLDFDFGVTSFRMYNVYGPRQAIDNPYQGVLGIFLGNVLRDEPLTIFGDGEQSRDFVYIDDVVDAWVSALTERASHGQVLNLGSGRQTAIKDLADQVLAAAGREDQMVTYAPGRPGEQRHVQADITRAGRVLGWRPRTPFAEGFARTVEWARSVMDEGSARAALP
ncbi:NAD-dependent epimerase/dehydratase family protein [Kocuria sp. M4R2S49]|uniref:NAD-dependent epimerase/dehydratase family protein n=1 Tax=Kocuria rhizosphaericola TaxID=3376284 RepID=UPI0037B6852D